MFKPLLLLCFTTYVYPMSQYPIPNEGRWERDITWGLSQQHPCESLSYEVTHNIFSRVVAKWNEIVQPWIKITEAVAGETPDIKISFVSGEHGDGIPFKGPGDVIGHTFYPINGGAIHLDNAEEWSDENSIETYETTSLYYTALHEFGHALGLRHTDDENSIMYPFYRDIDSIPLNWIVVARQEIEEKYAAVKTKNETSLRPDGSSPSRSSPISRQPNAQHLCLDYDSVVEINNRVVLYQKGYINYVKSANYTISVESIWPNFNGNGSVLKGVMQVFDPGVDLLVTSESFWLYRRFTLQYGYPKKLRDLGIKRTNSIGIALQRN